MARPRSFDEDEVLLVAQDHFCSTGYAAARVDDIAAATGLGKGSLYGAFGDKHQLFLRVFDDYCAAVIEAVRQALDGPDAGAYERLRVHVLAVADATASDVFLRGCLLAKGTAELAAHDPAVAARARQTFEALEELIASCVAGAQRAGDIRPDTDPARLAGLLLAVLRGIEALGKGGSNPASLRDRRDRLGCPAAAVGRPPSDAEHCPAGGITVPTGASRGRSSWLRPAGRQALRGAGHGPRCAP
jgi:AcrR family transcriptional regulator